MIWRYGALKAFLSPEARAQETTGSGGENAGEGERYGERSLPSMRTASFLGFFTSGRRSDSLVSAFYYA